MARRRRHATLRAGALAAGAVVLLALVGTVGAGPDPAPLGSVGGAALHAVRAVLPDEMVLPPAVAEHLVDAVTDRAPVGGAGPHAVVGPGLAGVALAAALAGTVARRRRAALGVLGGPGSTRAPPVTR